MNAQTYGITYHNGTEYARKLDRLIHLGSDTAHINAAD